MKEDESMHGHTDVPIRAFDPEAHRTANEILTALTACSFQGRALGVALDVLESMVRDEDCGVVLTLAGAMVPAGMREIVCRLMERGVIQAIVSTGANLTHDLVDVACGGSGHFRGDPDADDDELYRHRINRIYDTNLPEENYQRAESLLEEIWRADCEAWRESNPESPWILAPSEVFRRTGTALAARGGRGILAVAAATETPIFCGATSDSEFCLDFARFRHRGWCPIVLDEIADLFAMGDWVRSWRRRGAFIIGGGVPRNWAQQVFPLLDMIEETHYPGYDFGVRICTDSAVYGGLSGCTMSESKSWGKYGPQARFAEVSCDATIALPLLSVALFERLDETSRSGA